VRWTGGRSTLPSSMLLTRQTSPRLVLGAGRSARSSYASLPSSPSSLSVTHVPGRYSERCARCWRAGGPRRAPSTRTVGRVGRARGATIASLGANLPALQHTLLGNTHSAAPIVVLAPVQSIPDDRPPLRHEIDRRAPSTRSSLHAIDRLCHRSTIEFPPATAVLRHWGHLVLHEPDGSWRRSA